MIETNVTYLDRSGYRYGNGLSYRYCYGSSYSDWVGLWNWNSYSLANYADSGTAAAASTTTSKTTSETAS